MTKPGVSKPELRVVTAHADVLSPLAGTGDIGSRCGRQPVITDRQRDYFELLDGLTKKQKEEHFRKIFKMRNQQTAAKAEEEVNHD